MQRILNFIVLVTIFHLSAVFNCFASDQKSSSPISLRETVPEMGDSFRVSGRLEWEKWTTAFSKEAVILGSQDWIAVTLSKSIKHCESYCDEPKVCHDFGIYSDAKKHKKEMGELYFSIQGSHTITKYETLKSYHLKTTELPKELSEFKNCELTKITPFIRISCEKSNEAKKDNEEKVVALYKGKTKVTESATDGYGRQDIQVLNKIEMDGKIFYLIKVNGKGSTDASLFAEEKGEWKEYRFLKGFYMC